MQASWNESPRSGSAASNTRPPANNQPRLGDLELRRRGLGQQLACPLGGLQRGVAHHQARSASASRRRRQLEWNVL
jgi:hypothetical protein